MSTAATPEARFAELVERLSGTADVTVPEQAPGRVKFGSMALKVNGKIFAMLSGGNLVLKLPHGRVEHLVASGQGSPFDGGKGRPMKEWVAIDPDRHSEWEALSRDALEFVRGKA